MLDHQSGDGAPPRNIHHWGPSHSTSSDDQSQPRKGGGFTNSFNFAKASKLIRPTAQQSSSSDKTDPNHNFYQNGWLTATALAQDGHAIIA
jgi:hypothetical protein